ncbi:MAG: aldehyde dehydrogenase family protein [Myxococcota bacterium]|nr:aldehyde dehydrogenase family protein [Myxococcota bacterium]
MAVVERIDAPEAGAQAAEPDGRRSRQRLLAPGTLEPIGEVELATPGDVEAAVERARKAAPDWAALPIRERGRILERAVSVLLERQDEWLETLTSETSKPELEAFAAELLTACDALTFYARRAHRILADQRVPLHLLKSKRLKVRYHPLGVVGIITPWNFPFILSLNPTAQALVAGNAVVLKPSEVTPLSGRLVAELFEAAGLPEGVLQCVVGDGGAGAALVASDVDKICFTGSVETGRLVGEECGRRLRPCTLELGGKDAMIVCADADLDRAAGAAVFGAFANSGQVCLSTERVYVVDEVADVFQRKVVERTSALRQGPGGEADVGAMIHGPQLEIVERQVADAVARGARVLCGGQRNPEWPGLYFEPTVLVDVDHGMDVMREETFGPVLPIMRVRDEDEALMRANDSRYGLSASVFCGDKRRGEQLAGRIESGSAVVNDTGMTPYGIAEAPFGGRKESGVGRVNGEAGLKGYCHTQSIVVDRWGSKDEPLWFPYTKRKERLLRRLARILWGTPLGRFLS